jgi:hypothetical protein
MEEQMESYIVRLYRRDTTNPENLVGLIETVGLDKTRSFHTVNELVAILSEPHTLDRTVSQPVLRVIEAGKKNSR